jgi:hypothetical protein
LDRDERRRNWRSPPTISEGPNILDLKNGP